MLRGCVQRREGSSDPAKTGQICEETQVWRQNVKDEATFRGDAG